MPLLTLSDITMNFGERRLLDGVSFRVNKGDRIAFVGDNGAGKSTLFKIIKGTLTPDGGEVILHGNTIAGFLSQNMDEQDLSGASLKPSNLIDIELKIDEVTAAISRLVSKKRSAIWSLSSHSRSVSSARRTASRTPCRVMPTSSAISEREKSSL